MNLSLSASDFQSLLFATHHSCRFATGVAESLSDSFRPSGESISSADWSYSSFLSQLLMPSLIRPSFSSSVYASLLFLLVFLHTDFVCFSLSILISSLVCFVLFSGFLYKKDQFEPPITAENWSLGSLLFGLILWNTFFLPFVFCQSNRKQQVLFMDQPMRQPKRHKKSPWVDYST